MGQNAPLCGAVFYQGGLCEYPMIPMKHRSPIDETDRGRVRASAFQEVFDVAN